VSQACFQEIQEGRGTKHGGVYLDLSHNSPGFIKEKLPMVYGLCEKLGMDLEKEPVEVAPTFHFVMGGIRVDERWHSSVKGLFAAGEVVGGVHGANRLSQNSLADVIVSGSISGESAAIYASDRSFLPLDFSECKAASEKVRMIRHRKNTPEMSLSTLKENLRNLMWDKVSFRRQETGLQKALDEICRFREEELPRIGMTTKSQRYNRELMDILEMENLLYFSELVTRSALMRKETRGAHFREDYPSRDDDLWLKHVVIKKTEGRYQLRTEEIDLNEYKPY
jgi:fumarate reductase (CoM/CoB) subunit A